MQLPKHDCHAFVSKKRIHSGIKQGTTKTRLQCIALESVSFLIAKTLQNCHWTVTLVIVLLPIVKQKQIKHQKHDFKVLFMQVYNLKLIIYDSSVPHLFWLNIHNYGAILF